MPKEDHLPFELWPRITPCLPERNFVGLPVLFKWEMPTPESAYDRVIDSVVALAIVQVNVTQFVCVWRLD